MGIINFRIETIQMILEDKVDCKTYEDVLDMLDDIRILSDAMQDALEKRDCNPVATSYNSLHKYIVMPSCAELKGMRLRRNLSMDSVAEKTGISKPTISRIERGKQALYDNVKTLHEFYIAHGA